MTTALRTNGCSSTNRVRVAVRVIERPATTTSRSSVRRDGGTLRNAVKN